MWSCFIEPTFWSRKWSSKELLQWHFFCGMESLAQHWLTGLSVNPDFGGWAGDRLLLLFRNMYVHRLPRCFILGVLFARDCSKIPFNHILRSWIGLAASSTKQPATDYRRFILKFAVETSLEHFRKPYQIAAVLAYRWRFQEHRSLLSLFSFAPNSFEYAAALAVGVAQGTNCCFDVVVVDVGVCRMWPPGAGKCNNRQKSKKHIRIISLYRDRHDQTWCCWIDGLKQV